MENYARLNDIKCPCLLEFKYLLSDISVEMEDICVSMVQNIMAIGSNHSLFVEVIVGMKSLSILLLV